MLTLPRSVRIFVATKPMDMRAGFDKLGRIVSEMGMDVYSGHLFAFVSRRGDRIKILMWDHGGFVLWYKRLERGRFTMPTSVGADTATVSLDGPSLAMLLDGIDVSHVRRPVHWSPKTAERDRHLIPSVIETIHDVDRRLRQTGGEPPANDSRLGKRFADDVGDVALAAGRFGKAEVGEC